MLIVLPDIKLIVNQQHILINRFSKRWKAVILLKPSAKQSTGKKGFVLWEELQSSPVKEHSILTQVRVSCTLS